VLRPLQKHILSSPYCVLKWFHFAYTSKHYDEPTLHIVRTPLVNANHVFISAQDFITRSCYSTFFYQLYRYPMVRSRLPLMSKAFLVALPFYTVKLH
jgi:hypothetical protein